MAIVDRPAEAGMPLAEAQRSALPNNDTQLAGVPIRRLMFPTAFAIKKAPIF